MKLYSYYRSSAAYRVRIALNIKQIAHQIVPVNLLQKEHKLAAYVSKQPQALVPCIELDDGLIISQSGAILAYLESTYSQHRLVPDDPLLAAQMRMLTDIIACDVHPLNNLRVLNYLKQDLAVSEQHKQQWYAHWIVEGFSALETQLSRAPNALTQGVTMLDVYLVPQVYNALRFKVDLSAFTQIKERYQRCNEIPAFIQAQPEKQEDCA